MQHIVGADAHIGPFGSYEFAADYRKIGAFCRADVSIGPYRLLRRSTTLPVRGSYGTDI